MKKSKIFIYIIHWIIIINFIIEIFYGAYQTFVVLAPEGQVGPLFGSAASLSYEQMVIRRLYAIETWIAITGLSIYLAITEIYPRMKKIGKYE
ncbi:MAG: hypothetical protein ACTSQP_16300 [Promethearchaeota archaeon]